MTPKARKWALICCCCVAALTAAAVVATRKEPLASDDPARILKYMGSDPSNLTHFEHGFQRLRQMGARAIIPIVGYLRKHDGETDRRRDVAEMALECIALIREKEALPKLIELASDRHILLSLVCVTAIREIATADDLEELNGLVRRRGFRWKTRLIEAIGALERAEPPETLLGYLKDEDPRVRRGALFGLKRRGDPAALPHIRQCFESEKDPEVRITAAEVLCFLGEDMGTKWISKTLQTSDDKTLLWRAIYAAGRLGGPTLTDDLGGLLSHEEWFLRCVAGEALMNIGTAEALALIDEGLDQDEKRLLEFHEEGRLYYSHDRGFMDWEYDLMPMATRMTWTQQKSAPRETSD